MGPRGRGFESHLQNLHKRLRVKVQAFKGQISKLKVADTTLKRYVDRHCWSTREKFRFEATKLDKIPCSGLECYVPVMTVGLCGCPPILSFIPRDRAVCTTAKGNWTDVLGKAALDNGAGTLVQIQSGGLIGLVVQPGRIAGF
jgi:hypothetical protein